jgi:hypothetical protein
LGENLLSNDYDVLEIRKPNAEMADIHDKLVQYLSTDYKRKKMDETLAKH